MSKSDFSPLTTRLKFSRHGLFRYIRNTSWMFIDKTLAILTSFVIGVWLARYLGPSDYGVFSYINAFIALFSVVAVFGIDSVVVRDLGNDSSRKNDLLGTACTLRFLGGAIALGLAVLVQFFLNPEGELVTYTIIVGSSLLFSAFTVIDLYFQSEVKSKYVAIANCTCVFCGACVKIYLLLNDAEIVEFFCVILLEAVIFSGALITFYLLKAGSLTKWRFDLSTAKELLRSGLPLMLSGAVVVVYMKVDQLMLQEMLGFTAVGHYAAASRLSEFWYFIPGVVTASLFPALVQARKTDWEVYQQRFQALTDLVLWSSILLVVAVLIAGGFVIDILFGNSYAAAKPVLSIHVMSGVFAALGIASANWFVQEGLYKYLFFRSGMGAILNVGLNLFLIPKFGISGAAIATLIAQMVSGYLFNLFSSKTRSLFIIQSRAFTAPLRFLGVVY